LLENFVRDSPRRVLYNVRTLVSATPAEIEKWRTQIILLDRISTVPLERMTDPAAIARLKARVVVDAAMVFLRD
jgi:hypothetical protein